MRKIKHERASVRASEQLYKERERGRKRKSKNNTMDTTVHGRETHRLTDETQTDRQKTKMNRQRQMERQNGRDMYNKKRKITTRTHAKN